MAFDNSTAIFASTKRALWHSTEPAIWSVAGEQDSEDPERSVLRTLFDQPRWLEAYHLYDDRGSELFETICELPGYYLTRTENSILMRDAARIIEAAPVQAIVELGAGSARKTRHLLEAQIQTRGRAIFAPIDVSLPGLRTSRDNVRAHFPQIEFYGLHARYEEGFASIDQNVSTLFVFLGSSIGNLRADSFVRFFSLLSHAMGPRDFLLLGIDRVKPTDLLTRAYADSRGVTAEFILNVFNAINRTLESNFERAKMRYHSTYNANWQQVEMYAVSTESQHIRFPRSAASFLWEEGDEILVEVSRKFNPERLEQQLRFFDLKPVGHFTDPNGWFSLLLFKKIA